MFLVFYEIEVISANVFENLNISVMFKVTIVVDFFKQNIVATP